MTTHASHPAPVVGPITPPVKNSFLVKILLGIFISVVFFIAIVISFVIHKPPNDDITNNKKLTTPSEYVRPNEYTEYYTLKKGDDPIRVTVPDDYECNYSGGGKKYYRQPQNGKKQLIGGDIVTPKTTKTAYSDLSFYEEEITVVCTFKKMK